MGIEAALLTQIAAGTSIVTGVAGVAQNLRARREQKEAQNIQRAQNKAAQQEEQRRQIREERIRRARILQSAENTGTTASSGELGAVGSLATTLSANIGANISGGALATQMSTTQQDIANATGAARTLSGIGQMVPGAAQFANSIFAPAQTELQGPLINQVFPNQ